MTKYNPQKIEKKWQDAWQKQKLYITKDSAGPGRAGKKKNFYTVVELPYTSGDLHIGHWYAFAVPDMFARFKRMQGYNVLYPIGYDAFGLPAENAAIKRNLQPKAWTEKNIKNMRQQMHTLGSTIDWSREISTADPEYYKWTQWIFLQFYKAGLAYRAKTLVNWCSQDKTVLANEQVVDGKCDRCGSAVEQREREQWMYRITKYADQLLDGLDKVDWPEVTKTAQRNWIGKSEGAEIVFQLTGINGQEDGKHSVTVFTTRPDTIFGATFLVVSPEKAHEWMNVGWTASQEVKDYVKKSINRTEQDRLENKTKTGVFAGIHAINPANNEKIPVWIADYVLSSYGTGAIMAVPAHDERDNEFAKKFDLPIIDAELVDSEKIIKELGAKKKTLYRLRDWILSRQRYWGTPIPLVFCKNCAGKSPVNGQMSHVSSGYVPVPEKDLPVELPTLKNYLPADDGSSPLARAKDWVNVKCPNCKQPATRETDTMDTFVDSSWYFIRYTDAKNKSKFADAKKINAWLPMNLYFGGAEHNTMHLLYARFFTKALHDISALDFDEPFTKRVNHGTVLGPDGNKMSKSKGNVINPDEEVKKYGADTVRMYLAFLGPYDTFTGPWNPSGILGINRFLHRVWKLTQSIDKGRETRDECLEPLLHQTIKKVTEDLEALKFNTAISALMTLLNEIETYVNNGGQLSKVNCQLFLLLLAPFAPHITEELWSQLDTSPPSQKLRQTRKSIHLESWPTYDPKLIAQETATIAVQINGKTRATIELPSNADQSTAEAAALNNNNIKRHLGDSQPKKVIFVKNRLLNFVI